MKYVQHYLIKSGTGICTRNQTITGIKFLFRVTLRRHDLVAEIFHLKEQVKVPLVLSNEEIKRILAMAHSTNAHVMSSLAYGCGMRAGEVVRLKVSDIDSAQEIIRIVQAKGRKDRNVMLPSDILGLLREWWIERPTGQDKDVSAPERVLFPVYRGKHLSARQISRLFKKTAREAGINKDRAGQPRIPDDGGVAGWPMHRHGPQPDNIGQNPQDRAAGDVHSHHADGEGKG